MSEKVVGTYRKSQKGELPRTRQHDKKSSRILFQETDNDNSSNNNNNNNNINNNNNNNNKKRKGIVESETYNIIFLMKHAF